MQELKNIKYGSARKTALYYMKMKNSPVEFERIFGFIRHYNQRPGRFMESLRSMQADGLVQEVSAGVWQITSKGINAVYELGRRDRGRDPHHYFERGGDDN